MNIYELVEKLIKAHPMLGPLLLTVIAIGIFASSIQSYILFMKVRKSRKNRKAP